LSREVERGCGAETLSRSSSVGSDDERVVVVVGGGGVTCEKDVVFVAISFKRVKDELAQRSASCKRSSTPRSETVCTQCMKYIQLKFKLMR
jgi:hypothetical protein